MNKLIVIGAGGHGKVIADIAMRNGYQRICFVDDNVKGDVIGFPVVGTIADIEALDDGKTDFVIGIGNNAVRKEIAQSNRVNWVSLIHPSAQIAFNANIEEGTVVMANAAVNVCASIGRHCIINTGAVVEHDNVLQDYVHISPNAALAGTVFVGTLTHIGIGATVNNNIKICDGSVIGAGAVVTKTIEQRGTYFGVPARKKQ